MCVCVAFLAGRLLRFVLRDFFMGKGKGDRDIQDAYDGTPRAVHRGPSTTTGRTHTGGKRTNKKKETRRFGNERPPPAASGFTCSSPSFPSITIELVGSFVLLCTNGPPPPRPSARRGVFVSLMRFLHDIFSPQVVSCGYALGPPFSFSWFSLAHCFVVIVVVVIVSPKIPNPESPIPNHHHHLPKHE